MLKRLVTLVEIAALLGALVFVFMLFGNEPESGSGGAVQSPGARIYSANCSGCHGADGGGSTGPQLSGGTVVRDFPNVDDQVRFVTKGRDGMPAFGGRLKPADIRLAVEYTRTL
jgi:mono/diheme cytochrome c family protein